GRVCGVELRTPDEAADGPSSGAAGGANLVDSEADLVVLACGTTPETGPARAAGLAVGRGVVVGDDLASPDDPRVFAIGDCAEPPEGGTGLIAQGWDQSRRLAAALASAVRPREGAPGGGAAATGHRPRAGTGE